VEELEEVRAHRWVVLGRGEVLEGGGSTEQGGRRSSASPWWCSDDGRKGRPVSGASWGCRRGAGGSVCSALGGGGGLCSGELSGQSGGGSAQGVSLAWAGTRGRIGLGRGGSKRGAPRWPRGRRRPWRRAAPVGAGKLGPWLWREAERRGESVVGFVRRLEQRQGQWRGDGETTTFDGVSCRGPPGARGECGRRQGCRCVGKTGGGGGSFG
jgi:hypothetical protein